MRVVIGEDQLLFREGLVRVLSAGGFDVVAQTGDADDLARKGMAHRPDVLIADVRMPPRRGDDGLRAALEVRRRLPRTGVLVLSQYIAHTTARELIAEGPDGVGYLLKERVADLDRFLDAVRQVGDGGSALDPIVVGRLVGSRDAGVLDLLTTRELDVLALMAEGRSNRGIGKALVVTDHAVEKHVRHILRKLDIAVDPDDHRRVLAVLSYLRTRAVADV